MAAGRLGIRREINPAPRRVGSKEKYMKYVKMLGLLAVAAAALMAFAGTASATIVTAPAGTAYTGKIHASTENGHAILHNAFTTVECSGTVEGTVETHSLAGTAHGKISVLTFPVCTGTNTVTVAANGLLEIHAGANGHGTLTSSGTQVVITNHEFGGTCIYTTNNTQIGTLTPAPTNTGHATLDITASIPRTGGSLGVFCGSTGTWTGNYKVNTPTGLRIS
jgi:hypothetical protein